MTCRSVLFAGKALWQFLKFDITGASASIGRLEGYRPDKKRFELTAELEAEVSWAIDWAASVYFRPVRCLQRSLAAAALLRQRGVQAQLVVGYRLDPFLGHAWIEADGHVVIDSATYNRDLTLVSRI